MPRDWNFGNGSDGRFGGSETMRARREANLPVRLPIPADFEDQFIAIGRVAVREHYQVGRQTIDRWLDESGKERVIKARAAKVKDRIESKRISRSDIGKILAVAFPVVDRRRVSPILASRAAHFLRISRNGGFIVTRARNGDWRVGMRVLSPAQIVDLAKAKGFQA